MQILVLLLVVGIFMHDELRPPEAEPLGPPWVILTLMFVPRLMLAGVMWGLCRWTRKRLSTRYAAVSMKLLERFQAVNQIILIWLYAADLLAGGLLLIRSAIGGDLVLIDELLMMLPTLGLVLFNWWAYYPIDRRLRERLEGQGFHDRRKRGFGYLITPDEIEERPPSRPRELFRMIPGLDTGAITGRPMSDGLVTFDCGSMAAYVNGIREHGPTDGPVWDMGLDINMADIFTVEVYPRMAVLPIEYSGLGVCAVILVWTW